MSFEANYKNSDDQNQYMDSLVVKNQNSGKKHRHESLKQEKSPRTKKNNNTSWGVPLIAVLISGISLSGCVFLYFNALALQKEVDQLKAVLMGRSIQVVQNSNQTGLLRRFDRTTTRIDQQIAELKLWANFSGCVPGNDVVIR